MLKVSIVYNKKSIDEHDVINVFGMVTKEHEIKKWRYLNPFKNKAPMKNWFQMPYSEKTFWKKLAIFAINNLSEDKTSKKES